MHGRCITKGLKKRDLVTITDSHGEQYEFSQKYIAEIVQARMAEILEKVNDEFTKIQLQGLLPAGVIFTGGGAKINGLIDLAKETLGLPASIGYPIDVQGIQDHVGDLSFTTAVGLVVWGAHVEERKTYDKRFPLKGKRIAEQVQKIFRSLMP